MATKTDYNALAQAFLRIWQDQLHQQMTNPEAIKTMLAAMRNLSGGAYDTPRNPTDAPDASDDAIRSVDARLKRMERAIEQLAKRVDALATKAPKPARSRHKHAAKPVAAAKRKQRGSAKKPVGRSTKTRKKR